MVTNHTVYDWCSFFFFPSPAFKNKQQRKKTKQGFDVAINESALTGESMLIKKTPESDPFLLAGTQVMEGGGTMIVTAVGENSQQGIILMLLADQDKEEGKSTYCECTGTKWLSGQML